MEKRWNYHHYYIMQKYGYYYGNVWRISHKCMENITQKYGYYYANVWRILCKCKENITQMYGEHYGNVWRQYGKEWRVKPRCKSDKNNYFSYIIMSVWKKISNFAVDYVTRSEQHRSYESQCAPVHDILPYRGIHIRRRLCHDSDNRGRHCQQAALDNA